MADDTAAPLACFVAAEPEKVVKKTDADADVAEAEREADLTFAPVQKLEEVETKTNEEDEDKVWGARAKLYRFAEEEWKDRGVGEVRFMKHRETGKIRVLMRREKTLKVCLNHFVSPQLNLVPSDNSDVCFLWKCPADYAENPPTEESFLIRFKTVEEAKGFEENFNKAKENNQ